MKKLKEDERKKLNKKSNIRLKNDAKGITLVALVITIIVLIILAGVSINLILGDNGIITVAKKAKENIELAKIEEETELNELYTQLETNGSSSGETNYDAIAKLTEFKTAIANYIEEAGGVKPEVTVDTAIYGKSIKGIVKEVTKNATATADNISEGKTAWVNGELITGTSNMNSSGVAIATWQLCKDAAGTLTNNLVYYNDNVSSNNENKLTLKNDGTISIYGCCNLEETSNAYLNIYINNIAIYTYKAKSGNNYHVYKVNDINVSKGDEIYITTSGGKPGYYINTNSTTIIYQ